MYHKIIQILEAEKINLSKEANCFPEANIESYEIKKKIILKKFNIFQKKFNLF